MDTPARPVRLRRDGGGVTIQSIFSLVALFEF